MATELRRKNVLSALANIADGVAGLLGIDALVKGQEAADAQLALILDNQEKIMADFTALNAKLDEQSAALSEAQTRIADDVQDLKDQVAELELDAADQEAVDAAVEKLSASVDTLKGIDPVKPADEPTEAPTV